VSLIHTHPGRPVFVQVGTGRVYISVHDDEYRRQRVQWRQRLADAHPDRSGTRGQFEKLHAQYVRWQQTEEAWYAQYGLKPPGRALVLDDSDPGVAALDTRVRARLMRALAAPRSTSELAALLGKNRSTMQQAVLRLRREGVPILAERTGGREWRYVLKEPCRLPLRTRDRVLAALQSSPRTRQELATLSGINSRGISSSVRRLRQKGYPIVTRATPDGVVYALAESVTGAA
jgi:biotin operon repressor